MRREVVIAGNYSHDTLLGDTERNEPGGSAAYVSAVLRAAGVDFAVVANVGDDFRYADRLPPARVIRGARTTSFLDDYRTGERVATLRAAAPPLSPEDLLETCVVGMAVAVAAEVPAATLLRLRELSQVLLADAQGFVRAFDAAGRVLHRGRELRVSLPVLRDDGQLGAERVALLLDVLAHAASGSGSKRTS